MIRRIQSKKGGKDRSTRLSALIQNGNIPADRMSWPSDYKTFLQAQLKWAWNLSCSYMLTVSKCSPYITSISGINATLECWKAEKTLVFQHFSFWYQLKCHAHLSWAWKVYNLRTRTDLSVIWKGCRIVSLLYTMTIIFFRNKKWVYDQWSTMCYFLIYEAICFYCVLF